jgi:photosystem II stability/assembly factor-like uncharacterized protein
LFVSRDAGRTWKQLRAESLAGTSLMLPPAYPFDNRIFAMGPSGLQMSTDGGNKFSVEFPLDGGAAISPLFNSSNAGRRILVGGAGTIMEYWPDKSGSTSNPAPMVLLPRTSSTVAFSPDYASRRLIFLGSMGVNENGLYAADVDRCLGSTCTRTTLPVRGYTSFVFSPSFTTNNTMFAYTPEGLFMSRDAGENYTTVGLPKGYSPGSLMKVAVRGNALYVAYASYQRGDPGLYRSLDFGKTWSPIRVGSRDFESGARLVATLPDGTVLAAGRSLGIACSGDGGTTWSARCA